jgi:hypothetical protein
MGDGSNGNKDQVIFSLLLFPLKRVNILLLRSKSQDKLKRKIMEI